MAEELVLGGGFDPSTVAAMAASQVVYWYDAAVRRQERLKPT